jgi:hypothetical protein
MQRPWLNQVNRLRYTGEVQDIVVQRSGIIQDASCDEIYLVRQRYPRPDDKRTGAQLHRTGAQGVVGSCHQRTLIDDGLTGGVIGLGKMLFAESMENMVTSSILK